LLVAADEVAGKLKAAAITTPTQTLVNGVIVLLPSGAAGPATSRLGARNGIRGAIRRR
jgi:hypothetical protein